MKKHYLHSTDLIVCSPFYFTSVQHSKHVHAFST